ncbi:MAG: PorT family protein [Chitinophagales bacterium]|nr:PorT family protein [Chitinophagaceae bacterium]MCB9063578.1 PorT family protein [Chitinophagales bacterium]
MLLAVFAFTSSQAQVRDIMNMPEHDQKGYYFGITFGTNFSTYKIRYTKSFVDNDTFKSIQPGFGPGFNLGLMGNLRLSSFVDLRFNPTLIFSDKPVTLNTRSSLGGDSIVARSVESIYMHLPVQLKFKSDRIKNFRFYAITGVKVDYDMAANARSRRKDEFIKVTAVDFGYELGVGFEFYYPNFIFSPEIKLSQGLGNQLFKDTNIPLSNAVDVLSTRMIVISVHLEG